MPTCSGRAEGYLRSPTLTPWSPPHKEPPRFKPPEGSNYLSHSDSAPPPSSRPTLPSLGAGGSGLRNFLPSLVSPTEETVRRRTAGDAMEEREEEHAGERRLPTKTSACVRLINSPQEKTKTHSTQLVNNAGRRPQGSNSPNRCGDTEPFEELKAMNPIDQKKKCTFTPNFQGSCVVSRTMFSQLA